MTTLDKLPVRLEQSFLAELPRTFCLSQTPTGDPLLEYSDPGIPVRGIFLGLVVSGCLLFFTCIAGGIWACALPPLTILFVTSLTCLLQPCERMTTKQVELQAEQLLCYECHQAGVQSLLQIPKTDIKAIRIIHMDESRWHIRFTLTSGQIPLVLDVKNADQAHWLGATVAAWAGLVLIWKSANGFAALYERIPMAAQPTRPNLTALAPSPESRLRIVVVAFLLVCALAYRLTLNSWVYREWYPLLASPSFKGILLCVSLLLCFWLLAMLAKPDPLRRRFRYEHVETQGWVTQRWIEYANAPANDRYYIAYTFSGGEETRQAIDPVTYAALQVGQPLRVCYFPNNPQISCPKLEAKPRLPNVRDADTTQTAAQ